MLRAKAGEPTNPVVTASYTDGGGPGVGPLTGRALHVLQPKRKQAEYYDDQSGVVVRPSNEPGGHGAHITEIEDGDWIAIEPADLRGIDSVTYRWSALGLGGRIEVHVDAPDGPLISDTGMILPTGDDQVYQDVTAPITDPGGTHKLYFVFKNVPLVPRLFNINWIDFNGDGVSAVDVDLDGVDKLSAPRERPGRQRRNQQHRARRNRRRLSVRRRQRQRHRERPGRQRDQAPRSR